jgi:seryl-tRNA synthetase
LIDKTTQHIDTLNEELNKEKRALETKVAALQSQYDQSQKEIASLKLGQDEQLLSLKDEFESLRKTFQVREETYEAKIEELSQALAREQEEAKTLVKNVTLQKPQLIASLTCDDMESGVNTPTLTCKARVEEFLRDFEPTHFFEVVPIVDDGGFATLKRVGSSNLGVPEEEIIRLTRLSNLGLGKDRAASGGKLIEEHFDGLARVSYAVEGVEMYNKRGFVIKVYR